MLERPRLGLAVALTVAALGAAAPAAGDWLVLDDGTAVEIEGQWQVRGKLVVFKRPGGVLSSLRLADVDLEASERRTAAAAQPPPAPVATPAPPVEPVLVLTDADVRHVAPAESLAETAADEAADGESAPDADPVDARPESAGSDPELRVSEWSDVTGMDFRGTELAGTLSNQSDSVAVNLALTVILELEDGRLAGRTRADLGDRVLEPGASTSFRARFPGIYEYESVEFEPRSFSAVRREQPGELE